jgi:hypothetical protein
VAPTGGKLVAMKYRFDGKEKLLSFGAYPDMSDSTPEKSATKPGNCWPTASTRRTPESHKATKAERAANTFEVVAREWYGKYSQLGRASRRPHPAALRARYFPVDRRPTHCRNQGFRNCWPWCAE